MHSLYKSIIAVPVNVFIKETNSYDNIQFSWPKWSWFRLRN